MCVIPFGKCGHIHMICNFNNVACSLLLSNFYLNEKEQLATLKLIILDESFGTQLD